jgi:hypothetical protein
LVHRWILGEIVRIGSGVAWVILVAWSLERLGWKSFSIEVIFNVHFPGGVVLMKAMDDVACEGFVSSHGNKGVAEEVVFAASIVALDDPKYGCEYLTSLS